MPDDGKLLKSEPTGGLIAVIGDDNNEFIYVGQTIEFTATRDGALFLGVNESNLNDNTGAFDVTVKLIRLCKIFSLILKYRSPHNNKRRCSI